MELLTNSAIKAFRACPRLHHYQFELTARPLVQSPALRFGSLAHAAMEGYWRARKAQHADPVAAAREAYQVASHLHPVSVWDRARLGAMLAAYFACWDARPGVTVLAVEQEFDMPLHNPETRGESKTFRRAGKMDLVLGLEDGRIAIVEHKTTSSDPGLGSEYRDRLVMDGQVSMYFRGAESLGITPDLCLYDVLVKPAIKPLEATPIEKQTKVTKGPRAGQLHAGQRERDESSEEFAARCREAIAENPNRFIVQIEVPRLEREKAESDLDIWCTAKMILESRRLKSAPRNPDACHRYGSTCAYLAVCQGWANIDDPTLFVRTKKNPELESDRSPHAA